MMFGDQEDNRMKKILTSILVVFLGMVLFVPSIRVSADEEPLYYETFDDNEIGGSYNDGTYEGVNGLVWSYKGVRGDETIDGSALTFGTSSENYISTTIPEGISKVEFKVQNKYGGSSNREIT